MKRKNLLETKTARAKVRIEQNQQELHLKFDSDLEAIQSAINIHQPHKLVMENLLYLMGILLFLPEPKNILLLGVGGGSLVHFFRHYLPQAHLTGIEYDNELLKIAHQQLKLPAESDNLSYVTEDARDYISRCNTHYDLILVDIFSSGQTPGWLLQKPLIQQLKNCLSENGAVAYNLLLTNDKQFQRFYQLLRQIFQHQTLYLETADYENVLVYALKYQTAKLSMSEQLEKCEQLSERYELPFAQILAAIYQTNPVNSGVI